MTDASHPNEAEVAAREAGLRYVSPDSPGLSRRAAGKGFSYRDVAGRAVSDLEVLARIRSLAIPPAWRNVWICADPRGHLQAMGVDARGRRQYRYHPRFRQVRDASKFEHAIAFAEALPALRKRVADDMASPGLGRAKVLATVVRLLETTMIRVGNSEYAKANKSYGLTTLTGRHARASGDGLRFRFRGKGGKSWDVKVSDRRVTRVVRLCQELPGQHLFHFLDENGEPQLVTSADVNDYLRDATGLPITAKDFRTWTATVLAAEALAELATTEPVAGSRQTVTQAVALVAERLGNTPTVCRKCYIHPDVIDAYLEGALDLRGSARAAARAGFDDPAEWAVLRLLRARQARKLAA